MCQFFVAADPILYESRTRTVRIRGVSTSIRMENFVWDTLACLAADGVANERVPGDAELGAEESGHRERDQFARGQRPARIAQRAELQRKADPVLRSASPVDMDQVVVRQDVMP